MGALCAPVVRGRRPGPAQHPQDRRGPRLQDAVGPAARPRSSTEIKRRSLAWGVGAASVTEIERLNIRNASHLAMRRALARIPDYDHVLVDGLQDPRASRSRSGPTPPSWTAMRRSYAIACASVIAKVTRDRLMAPPRRCAIPATAGSTTRATPRATTWRGCASSGVTPFHRRSYQRIRAILEGDQLAFDLAGEALDGASAAESRASRWPSPIGGPAAVTRRGRVPEARR